MEIAINQFSISFGSQYKIFINKKEEFYAETDVFSRAIINVYKPKHLQPSFKTFKSLYLNYPKYKIEISNGERYKLESKSFWKTRYQLKKDNDIYDLYNHKGRKVSIFKNNIQIGYWEKEAISYFAGNSYKILANDNSDKELLIAFCLILDNIHSKGVGAILNIDFGIVLKESRKFDKSWIPTKN